MINLKIVGRQLIISSNNFHSPLVKMVMGIITRKNTSYRRLKVNGNLKVLEDKKYYIWDTRKKSIIVSSRQLDEIKRILDDMDIAYTVSEKRPRRKFKQINDFSLKFDYRDKLQRDYGKYLERNINTFLCTMQTGKGKTGSTIISILKRKVKNRILIYTSPIFHHIWVDGFKKFTDMTDDNIRIISGREQLKDIENLSDDVAVIILSNATFRGYLKDYYDGEENYSIKRLSRALGYEYLIVDEAHIDFHNTYMTTLALNSEKVIALTARFDSVQDDRTLAKYKKLFIPIENRMPEQKIDKYVNVIFAQFRFEFIKRLKFMNRMLGFYNHAMLENSIMKNKIVMYNYFRMIMFFVNKYYDRKNRLLFLFRTKDMVREFYKYISTEDIFKNKEVTYYIQGRNKTELDKDVIVSTDKSAGTGVDIDSVQTTVNTISGKSEYAGVQLSGRTRKMEDVEQYYISLWSTSIDSHGKYKKANSKLFNGIAKKIHIDYYPTVV